MSKRGEFLKKCMELELSTDKILSYTGQMCGKPDTEKEKLAAAFLEELENRETENP